MEHGPEVHMQGWPEHMKSMSLCVLCVSAASALWISCIEKYPFRGFRVFRSHLSPSFRTVRSTDPESRKRSSRVGITARGFWIPARAPRQKPGRLAGMTQLSVLCVSAASALWISCIEKYPFRAFRVFRGHPSRHSGSTCSAYRNDTSLRALWPLCHGTNMPKSNFPWFPCFPWLFLIS